MQKTVSHWSDGFSEVSRDERGLREFSRSEYERDRIHCCCIRVTDLCGTGTLELLTLDYVLGDQ